MPSKASYPPSTMEHMSMTTTTPREAILDELHERLSDLAYAGEPTVYASILGETRGLCRALDFMDSTDEGWHWEHLVELGEIKGRVTRKARAAQDAVRDFLAGRTDSLAG